MGKIIWFLALTLAVPAILIGQTFPTVISKDTVLQKENSPYHIASNLTINTGTTCKIEPGVVLEIAKGILITVKGNLIAEGTANDSIYFISKEEGSLWQRIVATNQICGFLIATLAAD
ncbi:MAG: hypothetical protein HC906_15210 [Bacteroidales bacterium]|nr:hypothetical protein [Bacteroidales bacterium]